MGAGRCVTMDPDDGRLVEAARRRARRAADGERERPVARNLAMIGAYGWIVAGLAVGGAFLGSWLDRRLGGGIMFSAALVMIGAGIGLWLVWRRMNEE